MPMRGERIIPVSSPTTRLSLYAATAAALPASAAVAGFSGVQISGNLTGLVYSGSADTFTLSMGDGISLNFRAGQYDSTFPGGAMGSQIFWAVSAGASGVICAVSAGSLLSNLAASATVNNQATFNGNALGFSFNGSNGAESGSLGQWANGAAEKSGYIGFKSGNRYGWVEVTWDYSGIGNRYGQLTIGDYAVGAAGQTVMAGVTPAAVPGLGGLAALACGAAGMRRSRMRSA
jgi:hypothetical protein